MANVTTNVTYITNVTPTSNTTVGISEALRNILIITGCLAALVLILLYMCFRYCCKCQKKRPRSSKTYETADPVKDYHGYEAIQYTKSDCESHLYEEANLERSMSTDYTDGNAYLSARPTKYQLPLPFCHSDRSPSTNEVEFSGVETIPKGVSVRVKDGHWHKTIDIEFQ